MHTKAAYTLPKAIKKLERYCSYQERCHKEVIRKLREMRMIPEVIDQILAHLIQENYLNEERFAKTYAKGKHSTKKWGRNRIVAELKHRGISKINIQNALEEINDTAYLKTLDELAKKRICSISDTHPQKRRRKLADYLLYRGWESHLVYGKVKELLG